MRKLKKADVQNFKTGLPLGRRPNIISLFIIKILKKKNHRQTSHKYITKSHKILIAFKLAKPLKTDNFTITTCQ
jgi:hypothetical protein